MSTYRRPDGTIVSVFSEWRKTAAGHVIELFFAEVDGRTECVRVTLGASFDLPNEPDPTPITATAWRDVAIGHLIADVRRKKAATLRGLATATNPQFAELAKRAAARLPAAEAPKRGRTAYHDLHAVADLYTAAVNRDLPPTQFVSKQLNVTYPAAANLVYRARGKGLLPPTTKGRIAADALPEDERDWRRDTDGVR